MIGAWDRSEGVPKGFLAQEKENMELIDILMASGLVASLTGLATCGIYKLTKRSQMPKSPFYVRRFLKKMAKKYHGVYLPGMVVNERPIDILVIADRVLAVNWANYRGKVEFPDNIVDPWRVNGRKAVNPLLLTDATAGLLDHCLVGFDALAYEFVYLPFAKRKKLSQLGEGAPFRSAIIPDEKTFDFLAMYGQFEVDEAKSQKVAAHVKEELLKIYETNVIPE
jgi:hypothetical protein